VSLATLEALDTPFAIGGREFKSRLMVGTGKYVSNSQMLGALEASGAEIVSVAVRRVGLERNKAEGILSHLSPDRYFLLANTAGCFNADDAIRYARLARSSGFSDWVMLEVVGDQQSLLPDTAATIEATRVLAAEGFKVMAFSNDDLVAALRLEDAGAACVMPFASPMGSALGLPDPFAIRSIRHRLHVPVIVNAGIGTASDAALTMEQGVDGLLVNTGIAAAADPVRMAAAMRLAVEAGRLAYLAGRTPRREVAVPAPAPSSSSPSAGMIGR
jgi:thiazole synthase